MPGVSRCAGDGYVARAGMRVKAAVHIIRFNVAGAGFCLDVALADLFYLDVSRAGTDRKASMKAVGVDDTGPRVQLRVVTYAFVDNVARAGVRVEICVSRGLDFIVDADVVEVFVAGGRSGGDACLFYFGGWGGFLYNPPLGA